MRSSPANGRPAPARRAWEAPAITELPIATETAAAASSASEEAGPPSPPASPATKLGFSFEMSFPLSARTE
ncbi:hypothetical protein [Pseudorhodoplanes sp.]|uniref:hypothetical protein n=1 Tax=Pseudorhodoplanes sp. TaxID=1934341 RepID=UPI002BF7955E|nr:hypothetical protein [Pseudorhodoplanes sp.]HWV42892.1 hypothetical protein [Pseudorhodoplanes sp.]